MACWNSERACNSQQSWLVKVLKWYVVFDELALEGYVVLHRLDPGTESKPKATWFFQYQPVSLNHGKLRTFRWHCNWRTLHELCQDDEVPGQNVSCYFALWWRVPEFYSDVFEGLYGIAYSLQLVRHSNTLSDKTIMIVRFWKHINISCNKQLLLNCVYFLNCLISYTQL